MAEPFRDEMSAALTRAEKLAEENQDLKDELRRLRDTAHSVRAQSPDDALATQTLAVLERLEAATHVDALATARAAAPLAEHADASMLTTTDDKVPWPVRAAEIIPVAAKVDAPPLPPPHRAGVRVRTLIYACLMCLFVGIMLGAMTR